MKGDRAVGGDAAAPPPRQYAVQRPVMRDGAAKWETLALVDDPALGRAQYRAAVLAHGHGYVRLVQVDFQGDAALADYDWKVIALHDPRKDGVPRPQPTPPRRPSPGRSAPDRSWSAAGEAWTIPWRGLLLTTLVGVAAGLIWALLSR